MNTPRKPGAKGRQVRGMTMESKTESENCGFSYRRSNWLSDAYKLSVP